jgi:hypothetical protein
MITLRLILLVLALVCFGAAAANVPTRGVQLLPLGLALWVLSLLVV